MFCLTFRWPIHVGLHRHFLHEWIIVTLPIATFHVFVQKHHGGRMVVPRLLERPTLTSVKMYAYYFEGHGRLPPFYSFFSKVFFSRCVNNEKVCNIAQP